VSETTPRYEALAISDESTVVAEFTVEGVREAAYQSEAELERNFVAQLEQQAYVYLPIACEEEMIANLRRQLEALNRVAWAAFIARKKSEELERIILEEGLDAAEAKPFVDNAFRDGAIPSTGTAITRILPPLSRFTPGGGHAVKKLAVLDRFRAYFERYSGLA
jgi:hypothetical protein